MKSFRETEKAVELEMVLDFYDVEKTVSRKVWIPKSQIRDGKVTAWILAAKTEDVRSFAAVAGGCFGNLYDSDGVLVETAESEKFRKGCENYSRLIELAKNAGVKGVRVGLRRATIEAKLAAAGVAF